MILRRITRGALVLSLAGSLLAAAQAQVQAEQAKSSRKASEDKGTPTKQRASGVILKVENVAAREGRAAGHRLTINTDAVWSDWARDQVKVKDTGSARADAAEGKNSVATRGEPLDKDNLVVVDVVADTRVETRFGDLDDETGKGSKTPEAVSDAKRSGRPVEFKARDLKTGLFVEVEFRHDDAKNQDPAATVTVIRPIEKLDTGKTERPKSAR